ncbi:MAG: hypothetical protein H6835_07345 [Planctomycetes bacterium]|nr:hypothetical protein [Planctomycetota bacterium]
MKVGSQDSVRALRPSRGTSSRGWCAALCYATSLAAVFGLASCNGKGSGTIGGLATDTTQPRLVSVDYGRLVDVYGLQVTADGTTITLYERDVVIGGDIDDERPANSNLSDLEITYDFIGADPDTLQQRLFIPRDVTSQEFADAYDALDDNLRTVTPMLFGTNQAGQPFSVVPRNAGLRMRFSAPLGIDDGFFVGRDAQGAVNELRNTEAVQLLRIVGDPAQPNGFVPMPVRVVVREREIVLDTVLLGSEGLQYQTTNNAAGLPASPDQVGANIRIAIALEGPLAIPRLRESGSTGITGWNNSQRNSIVRDFRSGNADDDSGDIARGFVRDPLPLRIVGEIPMFLERVDEINAFTQEITVFKNGLSHEIDRGDVIRFVADSSGVAFGSAEVVVDPADDLDSPLTQHVRVRIRRVDGLADIDPRNLPGYPISITEREPWLVQNAPRAICLAEFTAGDGAGRDDPRNFLTFTPLPLELNGYRPQQNEFVSPFAGAVVRFTKPVDISTVKWADTFFFAMRDLTTQASIDEFINNRPNNQGGIGMNPATFDPAKYRTPYLITARVFDEDGSQTSLRLQPTTGFYLDSTLRNPPAGADYRYFLHLISDSTDGGVRDLAGNRLDLQGTTADRANSVVIPFTIDTRMNGNEPVFADNLAISVVRRFASRDEDSNPSYFLPDEVQSPTSGQIAKGYPLEDLFGAFLYLDNKLLARPTTRARIVADNLNQTPVQQQQPPPAPANPLAACPQTVTDPLGTEEQITTNTANNLVPAGIQNPLNPYGCRLQTLWREIDLSLSRTDPFDYNLDVEQMYWAPYVGTNLSFDEFDRVSMWLGHCEYRPIPCVGGFSSLPSLPESGLDSKFEKNFAWNPVPTGNGQSIESQAPRRAAYIDTPLTIDPSTVVLESNGVNRFLPLPTFQKPYFIYRDETVIEQGGKSDTGTLGSDLSGAAYSPYILNPFSMGQGRRWVDANGAPGDVRFVNSFWNDAKNRSLTSPSSNDEFTGGLVGNVALPLLADFWTYCDSSELPAGGGYIALGTNGWQTAVTVQSDPRPYFRALSSGRAATPSGSGPICRSPGDSQWSTASGGFTPTGAGTAARDNTFYWIMIDALKRQTVITNGFVDLYNPHRVPEGFADPRLGPFYLSGGQTQLPQGVLPHFAFEFDPPLSQLPSGTSWVPQFRGASPVDPTPWYWDKWINGGSTLFPTASWTANARADLKPTAANFPLDPYKAGDAHMRKWDPRVIPGTSQARNWWTYLYNRTVTKYVEDPNELMDPAYTQQFAGPNETFNPVDIRYVNWRFIVGNNADASPPVSPAIDTFSLSYRFQPQ